jgi:hypothetical protein
MEKGGGPDPRPRVLGTFSESGARVVLIPLTLCPYLATLSFPPGPHKLVTQTVSWVGQGRVQPERPPRLGHQPLHCTDLRQPGEEAGLLLTKGWMQPPLGLVPFPWQPSSRTKPSLHSPCHITLASMRGKPRPKAQMGKLRPREKQKVCYPAPDTGLPMVSSSHQGV